MNAPQRPLIRGLRLVARTLSALILGLVAVMFIAESIAGEGPLQVHEGSVREAIWLTLFVIAFAGLVAGWRWELMGGALASGVAVVVAVAAIVSGELRSLPLVLMLGLPGGCFLLAGLLSRSRAPRTSAIGGPPPLRPAHR